MQHLRGDMEYTIVQEVKRLFQKSARIDEDMLATYRLNPVRYFFARKLQLTMLYNERRSSYLGKKIRRTTNLLKWETFKVDRAKKLRLASIHNAQLIGLIVELLDNVNSKDKEKIKELKARANHLISVTRTKSAMEIMNETVY